MQNVTQTPFLVLGADPSPCCSFVLPSTHSVVFCVAVVKCEILLVGNEKERPLDESLAINSITLKKLLRGSVARFVSQQTVNTVPLIFKTDILYAFD